MKTLVQEYGLYIVAVIGATVGLTILFGAVGSFKVQSRQLISNITGVSTSCISGKHNYESKVITEPTYEEYGLNRFTCKDCGQHYDVIIDKLVDSEAPEAEIIVADKNWKSFMNNLTFGLAFDDNTSIEIKATDEKSGIANIEYLISEKELNEQELENSSFEKYQDKMWVKHSEHGKYVIYARVTDKVGNFIIINSEGFSTKHEYTSTVMKEPTCTEKGEKLYRCICGDEYTEEIPDLGHQYIETVAEPTCTEEGYTEHECSVCGDEYRDTYTDKLGHSWELVSEKEPNCEEDGYKQYKCINNGCNETKVETIEKLGHNLITEEVSATCGKDGYTQQKCTRCTYKGTKQVIKATSNHELELVRFPAFEVGSNSHLYIYYSSDTNKISITDELPETYLGDLIPFVEVEKCNKCNEITDIIYGSPQYQSNPSGGHDIHPSNENELIELIKKYYGW